MSDLVEYQFLVTAKRLNHETMLSANYEEKQINVIRKFDFPQASKLNE